MPNLQIIIGSQLSKNAAETVLTLEQLITQMQENDMTKDQIRQALMADLNEGGRLFGAFRNQVKNTVKNGSGMAANESSKAAFEKAGVKEYKWVAVGDKSVCKSCERRHGEIGSMDHFKTIGVPRSGFSICQSACRCQLVPLDYKDEDFDKPLLKKPPTKKLSIQQKINKALEERGLKPGVGEDYRSKRDEAQRMYDEDELHYMSANHIKAYTSATAAYLDINEALRSGEIERRIYSDYLEADDETVGDFAENLTHALNQLPYYEGDVYRGLAWSGYGRGGRQEYVRFLENFIDLETGEEKSHWTNKGFISTSTDEGTAEDFLGKAENKKYKVMMQIRSSSGAVIDPFSAARGEEEILFSPGKRFKVKEVILTEGTEGVGSYRGLTDNALIILEEEDEW